MFHKHILFSLKLQEGSLIFTIVDPPEHGTIEHLEHNKWDSTGVFSMAEIYDNKVSYLHDGSETTTDRFTFTVTDGTNDEFAVVDNTGATEILVEHSDPVVIFFFVF